MRIYGIYVGFYVFDYFSTLLHCSDPSEEGGFLPYLLMQLTGSVSIGLTLNLLIMTVFWFLFFHNFAPIVIRFIQESPLSKYRKAFETSMFVILGFFPSIDFAAATSWYWQASVLYPLTIGLTIYIVLLFVWVKPLNTE